MRRQPLLRERKRAMVRFAKHAFFQIHAVCWTTRRSVPNAFESRAEAALAEAGEVIRRCPEEVRVREVERGLPVLEVAPVGQGRGVVFGREGAEVACVGEEEVKDYLRVEGPVAGVVEDEDGVDF